MRIWAKVTAVVGVIGFVTLLVFTDLGTAWRVWWSGESTMGMNLWWWPMLYWSRLGKLLQFTAGLAVVLDLVRPQQLRDLGRQAADRRAAAQENRKRDEYWQELAALPADLRGRIVRVVTHRDRAASTYSFRVLPEPVLAADSPVHPALDPAAVDAFVVRTHNELGEADRALKVREHRWFNDEVRRFLKQNLSEADAAALRRASLTEPWRATLLFGAVLVTTFAVVGLCMLLFGTEAGNLTGPSLAISAVTLIGGVIVIAEKVEHPLVSTWRIHEWIAAMWHVLARIFDRARPGHVFRKWAFALFLLGMHFDILAS